jgi:DNA gyrase subunit A
MHEMGLAHNKPYRKCAKIVGEVMGNFHPHGDAAIYDSLVRMAQDFSMRCVSSMDRATRFSGRRPVRCAVYRSLAGVAGEISRTSRRRQSTSPTYDESQLEPVYLPTQIPNLLVNGSEGIAVGMATKIPPHNLREVIDAVILQVNKPDASLEEIIKLVPGPDFPTGGFIYGKSGIRQAYTTGRGSIIMRAKAAIEKQARGDKEMIVITEIPYQINKALIERLRVGSKEDRGHLRHPRRKRPRRYAHRLRIEARRAGGGHPQHPTSKQMNGFGVSAHIVSGQPSPEPSGGQISSAPRVVRTRFEGGRGRTGAHSGRLEGTRPSTPSLSSSVRQSASEAREGLFASSVSRVRARRFWICNSASYVERRRFSKNWRTC